MGLTQRYIQRQKIYEKETLLKKKLIYKWKRNQFKKMTYTDAKTYMVRRYK